MEFSQRIGKIKRYADNNNNNNDNDNNDNIHLTSNPIQLATTKITTKLKNFDKIQSDKFSFTEKLHLDHLNFTIAQFCHVSTKKQHSS